MTHQVFSFFPVIARTPAFLFLPFKLIFQITIYFYTLTHDISLNYQFQDFPYTAVCCSSPDQPSKPSSLDDSAAHIVHYLIDPVQKVSDYSSTSASLKACYQTDPVSLNA
jgi:hypothetical protein